MNVLVIADEFPMPDRNSAGFRFSALLGMMAERHEVRFVATGAHRQSGAMGAAAVDRYRDALAARGVRIATGGLGRALHDTRFDAVMFEWYFPATDLIDRVRAFQSVARIAIDSVDVVFNRLEAKARLTKTEADRAHAQATKAAELDAYERADVVVTITDDDAAILRRQRAGIATFTIPNIHPPEPPVSMDADARRRLLFVGSFAHEPNVDAMVHFCRDVLPHIAEAEPGVRLSIVGSWPPAEVTTLASDRVEVLGYVPDLGPLLAQGGISIAPLRFGGGMKGKIGEAMSRALPVVTTSTGIEGFGLMPGRDVLVGDTAAEFADAVIRLVRDPELNDRVRMAGYEFIRTHCSEEVVGERLHDFLGRLETYPAKRIPAGASFRTKLRDRWQRHVAWRLKQIDH